MSDEVKTLHTKGTVFNDALFIRKEQGRPEQDGYRYADYPVPGGTSGWFVLNYHSTGASGTTVSKSGAADRYRVGLGLPVRQLAKRNQMVLLRLVILRRNPVANRGVGFGNGDIKLETDESSPVKILEFDDLHVSLTGADSDGQRKEHQALVPASLFMKNGVPGPLVISSQPSITITSPTSAQTPANRLAEAKKVIVMWECSFLIYPDGTEIKETAPVS